jgi:hypothetical protein
LREFFLASFTKPGLFFTHSDFSLLAMQSLSEKHPGQDQSGFHCSNGYIYVARAAFLQRMQHLLDTIDGDRIVNCDETNWLLWPNGLLTWAQLGQSSVQIQIDGDDKASFTAMTTITAS